VNGLTYHQRLSLFIMGDSCIVLTSIFFSRFLLSADLHVFTLPLIVSSIALLVSHHLFAMVYKLYKKAWEYASIGELLYIFKAVTFSVVAVAAIQQIVVQDIYFRLLMVTWMLHMLLIGGSRFLWRFLRDTYIKRPDNRKRTLIIGAGSAGTMVARQLLRNLDTELTPVAFIDDNERIQQLDVLGIPVVGRVAEIERAVREYRIDNIIIAIPSLSKRDLSTIFQECAKTKAKTQILPSLEDLVTGKLSVNHFRDVQVEDLLGREPVELDLHSISEYITGKVVLITGAGGSIGSELCRQVADFGPQRLVLLGHGENSIYSIEMELRDRLSGSQVEIMTEIADIQDHRKMLSIMSKHRPAVVYHAAAHKHVPLMENNPEEAVKNNIIGTMNVASAASKYNVGTFVMISTDKAVNPTSVMGATKRLAEMVIQHMDRKSSTRFVAVRFGNVLGSRGSVIPRFKQQIEKGGPVSVTHPDMVRYFMTIPEASRLVIQAGALARGGEIFVLDMGEPVKIVDLAKNLIKLSGYSIEEIGISFTGMRPGEKLFEELLSSDEVHEQQVYPKIYIGKTSELYMDEITAIIANLGSYDKAALREQLLSLANTRVPARRTKLISIG
jgi:FlaA1/EpsC-like NDP-sugar epimerase